MMTRTRFVLAAAAAMIALAAGTVFGQASVVGDRPDCVTAAGQAVYTGYGYSHSVHVANGCAYAVDCHVFTDVNPQVQNVHLEAGASTDVATFLSSPSRVFVAHVDCPSPRPRAPRITDPGE